MALELRPAHDPDARVRLLSASWFRLKDLSASDLAVASRARRQVGREESDRDSRRARRSGAAAARCCKAFKAVPPLDHRYQLSASMTASSTSPAGAPASCCNMTCPIRFIRSSPAPCGSAASRRTPRIRRPATAERRSADGGVEPRRQAHLFHQLAVRRVGRRSFTPRAFAAGW